MRPQVVALALFPLLLAGPASAEAYKYVHEVLPGERLRDIAKRYHTTVRAISRRNRLRRGRILRSGRKLKIVTSVPSRTRRRARYTVVRGDSLSRIAKKHKMKRWMLRRLNRRLKKRATLREGQRIWVIVEGPKPTGSVKGLYRLVNGPGYTVRDPNRRGWGTLLAVNKIHAVLGAYARRFPRAPKIRVLDLSRKGGGHFPPHGSHRRGVDVDICYPLKKSAPRYSRATPTNMHLPRVWWLLKRFIKTKDVTFIFIDYPLQRALYNYAKRIREPKKLLELAFQYPRRRRLVGIMRHSHGHSTHFHVRFRKMKTSKRAEKSMKQQTR